MRRAVGELVAVILTGAAFLVFENLLHLKLHFLVPCVLGWASYVALRAWRDRGQLREWGIRCDNLGRASIVAGVFLGVGALVLLEYRLLLGWRAPPVGAFAILLLYPIWGFLQQFVVQALVAGNLRRLGVAPAIVVPVAAVLFGAAHWPDWPLMALCAGAGALWTIVYFHVPNLIPLAITHAWLGTLAYYWVLERDPWMEMFAA